MRKPHEIEDPEHEQVVLQAAAVNVVKATGMVDTRMPRGRGALNRSPPAHAKVRCHAPVGVFPVSLSAGHSARIGTARMADRIVWPLPLLA
jgi:hypothetical protein